MGTKRSRNYKKNYCQQLQSFSDRLIKRQTPSEIKFAGLIESICGRAKLVMYPQFPVSLGNGKKAIFDFYIPDLLAAFEIDGGIHNKTESRDSKRDVLAGEKDIVTIRYKNEEVKTLKTKKLKSLILSLIERRFRMLRESKSKRVNHIIERISRHLGQAQNDEAKKRAVHGIICGSYKNFMRNEFKIRSLEKSRTKLLRE